MLLPHIYKVTCHTDHVGPGSTFVVIRGMKEDGSLYIAKALEKGATRIVVEDNAFKSDIQELVTSKKATLVLVPSARLALAQLSAQAYDYPARALRIIAVTGTKGKTTTSFLIEHLLKMAGHKTALLSTVENRILNERFEAHLTTAQPDYLHVFFDLCRSKGVEYVVMEVAAQALSLHRVATLTFDSMIFTNFSLEHSEFYATQEEYFQAKCLLFNQLAPEARVVLNADDSKVAACAQLLDTIYNSLHKPVQDEGHKQVIRITKQDGIPNEVQSDQQIASTGKSGTLRDRAQSKRDLQTISITGRGTVNARILLSDLSQLRVDIKTQARAYALSCEGLLGDFSAYNIAAAVAIVEKYGVSEGVVEQALISFKGVPGRLQRFSLPNGAVACIDNAHTPSSFEALLSSVRPLCKQLIVVFGAGGDRDALKRPLMGAIAAKYADTIILSMDNPRSEDPQAIIEAIKIGIDEAHMHKVLCILDREQAIRKAYALSKPGSLIALLGKGPVEYQHIKDTKIPFSEVAILRSL